MVVSRLLQAEAIASAACELPINFREGLLWLEVNVSQSKEPLRFLVDSGASASVLNLSTARRLDLKLGRKVSVTGVCTTLRGYWPVKLSAKADDVELPSEYLALDLTLLSRACSRPIDGLLGADFFHDRVVQIDYEAGRLRLLSNPPNAFEGEAIPLEARGCGLRVRIIVNGGKRQWVRLDTGCATALQWVTAKVPTYRWTSKPAVGLAELSIPQARTTVSLAGQTFQDVPTGLHRKPIFAGEAGLLGNGLLSRFGIVTIDSKAGKLVLQRRPVAE